MIEDPIYLYLAARLTQLPATPHSFPLSQGQLPARVQVWGQTLDPSKPSIAQNHAAINTAAQPRPTQQQQQQQQPFSAQAASAGGSSTAAAPTAATAAAAAADALAAAGAVVGSDESSDEEDDSSESDLAAQVVEGQTWLIFEFCDKGCLQVRGMGDHAVASCHMHFLHSTWIAF